MNITGRISKIIKKEKNGECIFTFDTTDSSAVRQSNGEVHCLGKQSRIFPAMPCTLEGEWKDGLFICQKLKPVWLGASTTKNYLKKNCTGTRLGTKTIMQICQFFGSRIFQYPKEDFKKLLKENFPKLSLNQTDAILCAVYQERPALYELEDILCAENVNYDVTLDIYEQYKERSVEILKANPYSIGRMFGYPMSVADRLAFRFGYNALDYKRIEGLLCYTLDRAASNGDTFMYADEIADRISLFSFRSSYGQDIPQIYTSCAIIKSKKIVQEKDKIALKELLLAEKTIARRLNVIKNLKTYIQIQDKVISEIETELDFQFGKDQKNAFHLLETGGVNILTGGPGTGKTSSVKGIVQYYRKINPGAVIEFCAPTGRAAKRLSESSGYPAKTIHKLLDLKPYEIDEDTDAPSCSIDADFIIIDESSMLGVLLLSRLLSAVPDECRILFVGDENQLPSIEAGNILHDMIASGKFPVYRLTENFRQKNGGSIYGNGQLILKGELPVPKPDFQIYKAKSEEDAYAGLCYLIQKYFNTSSPLEMQIIEPSRKGTAGTYRMNLFVHAQIVHKNIPDIGPQISVHDKVIFNHTNYELGYVNGDIGIVESLDKDEIVVDIGEELTLPSDSIHDMELGYAYTIHKSQGSENNIILIYLSEEMAHMMTRSLLYTAVTRAKQLVLIVYTGSALATCISNTDDRVRKTRLIEFL